MYCAAVMEDGVGVERPSGVLTAEIAGEMHGLVMFVESAIIVREGCGAVSPEFMAQCADWQHCRIAITGGYLEGSGVMPSAHLPVDKELLSRGVVPIHLVLPLCGANELCVVDEVTGDEIYDYEYVIESLDMTSMHSPSGPVDTMGLVPPSSVDALQMGSGSLRVPCECPGQGRVVGPRILWVHAHGYRWTFALLGASPSSQLVALPRTLDNRILIQSDAGQEVMVSCDGRGRVGSLGRSHRAARPEGGRVEWVDVAPGIYTVRAMTSVVGRAVVDEPTVISIGVGQYACVYIGGVMR